MRADYPDDKTNYKISGYYMAEMPTNLPTSVIRNTDQPRASRPGSTINPDDSVLKNSSPKKMNEYVLDQTRAQLQICTMFYGRGPYDNINITEQPAFNFGQSWPTLVYLPIMAYLDTTIRYEVFGSIHDSLTQFTDEVTPHEVAHQWFGHGAMWASYHDVWLSEGFAQFSAALFIQYAKPKGWEKDYTEFWDRQRREVMEKQAFGAPNDAGPIWLGIRIVTPKEDGAYRDVIYPKGAFILAMLRSLLYNDHPTDPKANRDQVFIDTMHDYMVTHATQAASTESFRAVVNKHVPPWVDLQKNGKLDWFFAEWVYGTQVPKYDFHYELQPGSAPGHTKIHATLTQSEVDDHFAMFVRCLWIGGEGMKRIGQIPVAGNNSHTVDFDLDRAPKKVAINVYKDILTR